jgi:hypothetical protein
MFRPPTWGTRISVSGPRSIQTASHPLKGAERIAGDAGRGWLG